MANWYYYTHYLVPIIPIILFRDYYFNYRYYSTIIPIILKYYYTNYLFCSLLYVLFAFLHYYPIPIFCIMRIIRIIDIIISFCYTYKRTTKMIQDMFWCSSFFHYRSQDHDKVHVLRQQALEPLRERGGREGGRVKGGGGGEGEGGREGGGENGRERWDQDDHITHHRQQLPFPFMCFRWTWWNKGTCIMRIIRIMRIIVITALLLPLQMRGLVE